MTEQSSSHERQCPVCGHGEFEKGKMALQIGLSILTGLRWIPDGNFLTREFNRRKAWTERCRNCGHLIFFADGLNDAESTSSK